MPKLIQNTFAFGVTGEIDPGFVIEFRGGDPKMLKILKHAQGNREKQELDCVSQGCVPEEGSVDQVGGGHEAGEHDEPAAGEEHADPPRVIFVFVDRGSDPDRPGDDTEKQFEDEADTGAGFASLLLGWPEFQIVKGVDVLVMGRVGDTIELGAGDEVKGDDPEEEAVVAGGFEEALVPELVIKKAELGVDVQTDDQGVEDTR